MVHHLIDIKYKLNEINQQYLNLSQIKPISRFFNFLSENIFDCFQFGSIHIRRRLQFLINEDKKVSYRPPLFQNNTISLFIIIHAQDAIQDLERTVFWHNY
jgi:hypothetical protein